MIDLEFLSTSLTESLGLNLKIRLKDDQLGKNLIFYPFDINETNSFRVEFHLGWRSITARFIPGNFSYSFVKSMSLTNAENKVLFTVFANSIISRGASINFNLNNQSVNPLDYSTWPDTWNTISIEMKKIGIIIENSAEYDFEPAYPWISRFLGLVISLLPFEDENTNNVSSVAEGEILYKTIKSYERSKINRMACIEIHGLTCKVCGFNFKTIYGDIGEGFIHIHHIVPLSAMGSKYVLNPNKDLIPVCPNCHYMLHRRIPVLSIEELKVLISNNNSPINSKNTQKPDSSFQP